MRRYAIPDGARLLYNGVDLDASTPRAGRARVRLRAELGAGDARCALRRLRVPAQGLDTALRALARRRGRRALGGRQ
jgi:hypothetical protein